MTNRIQHCSHFGRCGGCSRLDLPIEEQLLAKQQRARELLEAHLGGHQPAITLPPRTPRHDRTTILYPVQQRGRARLCGIYRRGTHDVEPIRDCRIQHRALTTFGVRAQQLLQGLDVRVYDEATGEGALRAIRARILPGTNELLVGAIATGDRFTHRDALLDGLHEAGRDLRCDQGRPVKLVGSVLNVNDRPGNALLGAQTIARRGRPFQFDRVGELRLRVSFESFYQLNRHAEVVLFRPALAMLGDVAGARVVDGYGGVGTFALRLLRDGAARVTLIESSPSACADARHNLEVNGFDDRAEVQEQAFGEAPLPACDVLVVDPPRAGLQQRGAAAVAACEAERVLLVSCSLTSLARDLELLQPTHRVEQVRLCDLFPHTEHTEAVTLLRRR